MIETAEMVGYGREAGEALAASVALAKEKGPLAPVTVIVPSNFIGLSARRLLGSGLVTSNASTSGSTSRPGLANVSFLTPFRLAEQLSSDLLLDQLPLTNPALGAAVRQALAADPGPYFQVREHEATEMALAALFAELSNVDDEGLESIATEGEQAGEIAVKLYRAIQKRLGGFHTEKELASAAADRSNLPQLVADLGHVIWYLPAPGSPAISRLIGRVLNDAESSAVIIGLTGDELADKPVLDSSYAADVEVPAKTPERTLEVADSIISVTDADEEVRAVIRGVLALVKEGTRADRIGIFYPTPDPYVRIIEQQFAQADVPANGPDRRRLGDSVAGRTLLAALALPAERWRRDRVMALVSGAPVRFQDKLTHPSAWEAISRSAGVLRDLSDWEAKLSIDNEHSQRRIAELADPDGDDAWKKRRLEDQIRDVEQLQGFVKELAAEVGAVEKAETWSAKCEAAIQLLTSLLGEESRHSSWPEAEQDAFARVIDALTRFAALDGMEPEPSSAVFLRALRSELDVARSRKGRFGEGVMYGPLSSAVGHDLDAVFIVGCAEGLLPIPRRDDAILPDRVRKLALDQLELKTARIHHQHREFLAALAAAPQGPRTLVFPRGDLRSSRHALPSRWLLDTASSLSGRLIHSTDFADIGEDDGVIVVPSYATGIRELEPSTSSDRDLQIVGGTAELADSQREDSWRDDTEVGNYQIAHPLARRVQSGLQMQFARFSGELTEFDGNLAGQEIPGTDERPLSPSRLEAWATCGFRYFLAHVLELSDRDDPESVEEISAMDRGSLIHHVLEVFISEAMDPESASEMPKPDEEWSEEHRRRLHEIAAEAFVDYEARGRTGRPVHWEVKQKDLLAVLDLFLTDDNEFRRNNRATPVKVELPFGLQGSEPLPIQLPNGQSLRFRGLADRIDTTEDGRVIVSDYKSGGTKKYKDLQADPVQAGQTLQLGLYAEAARRETGIKDASAAYWMLDADAKNTRKGYEWTENRRDRFIDVLTTITDGIAAGMFAAEPGDWDTFRQTNETCTYCQFDSVCPRSRGDQQQAKSDAPELDVRRKLILEDQG